MDSSQPEEYSAKPLQGSFALRLRRFLEGAGKVTNALAIAFLLLLLAVVFAMVLTRNVFNWGLSWLDDLARYVQIWAIYTGAIGVTMKGEHIAMDAVYTRMPHSWRRTVRRIAGMLSLIFCAITGYLALQQTIEVLKLDEVSSTGVFPAVIGYASLPFGFGLMTFASLYYLLYRSHQDDPAS